MRTRLRSIGGEATLTLHPSFLDAAHLGPESEVEVEVHGDVLTVRGIPDPESPVEEAFHGVVDQPGTIDSAGGSPELRLRER